MLLEIWSENKNSRWPPGSHIVLPIWSKTELDLCLICTTECAKFQLNCSYTSWDIEWKQNPRWSHDGHFGFLFVSKIELDLCNNVCAKFQINYPNTSCDISSGNGNSRWPPCSHIGFPIRSKIQHDLRVVCTNVCAKFQINCSNTSWNVMQKWKLKMTAWWPFWISDCFQNQIWPSSCMYQWMCKFSTQNPRWTPDSHFGFLILSKIKVGLCLICTNLWAKFQINYPNTSWDIEWKIKFKMAAL